MQTSLINLLKTIAVATLLSGNSGFAADLSAGETAFKVCTVCHGEAAEGNATLNAPRLTGLSATYLERQLRHFKTGIRGKARGDRFGSQMQPMAATLDDAGVVNVAAYIAGLPEPAKKAKPKVKGDTQAGAQLYATCLACHGAAGEGNEALGAPQLAGQSDWYLLRQLQNFKKGVRGSDPTDTYGVQMRPMATLLSDKKSQKNVVAYITTLN